VISLLDVSVLIALLDQNSPHHQTATTFFKVVMKEGWATCPMTENALLRILGHPEYPGGPGSVEETRRHFSKYIAAPGHQFWPDSISMVDPHAFPTLPVTRQLTDIYLLALALKKGGRLATFDQGINAHLLPGGRSALMLLEG
jgi:toxin-antitoxin system PIN domain toxin